MNTLLKMLIAVYLTFVLCVEGCKSQNSDTFSTFYSDVKQAKEDGAIKKGWLPDLLPENSRFIHEEHNIDTNFGRFSALVDQTWIENLDGIAKRASLSEINIGILAGMKNREWWPACLNGKLNDTERCSFRFYKYFYKFHETGYVLFIAADVQNLRVYCWHGEPN